MTAVSDARRYRNDPEAFVAAEVGLHLYSRQRDLVRAVLEHERVSCRAGNAVGKTAAAAFLILHHLGGGPAQSSSPRAPRRRSSAASSGASCAASSSGHATTSTVRL